MMQIRLIHSTDLVTDQLIIKKIKLHFLNLRIEKMAKWRMLMTLDQSSIQVNQSRKRAMKQKMFSGKNTKTIISQCNLPKVLCMTLYLRTSTKTKSQSSHTQKI